MATTLVTGAAGFAGSHLLDLLVRERAGETESIVGWRRPETGGAGKAGEAGGAGKAEESRQAGGAGAVRWEAVDVLDREAVRSAIARLRPSAVYHFAGAAHVGRAWDRTGATFAINVRGTHHLLDALSRADIQCRVLIPSSALVYQAGDRALREDDPLVPASPYGLSKLAQEMLASHAGPRLDIMVARAFNHIGPRQSPLFAASAFAKRIADIERGRSEPTVPVGNLDARRDLTDVRDTVRAYRLVLERADAGDVFNVCSGVAIAIREVLDKLIARARVPVRVEVDPARYRPNDTPELVGDARRIRERLGWTPGIQIDETINDLLEYWRA
jgi:GDP-4-dehydro-6-deoxy-D-mannose reductase